MTRELKYIQVASLLLLMLVTGFFWGTWFTLTRSMEDFELSEFTHIDHVITSNALMPLIFVMSACMLFLGAWVWLYPDKKSIGFYFSLSSFWLLVIATLVTLPAPLAIDKSENTQIAQLITIGESFGWREMQMEWKYFHSFRTFTSIASFCCLVLSIVWLQPTSNELLKQTRIEPSDNGHKISPSIREEQIATRGYYDPAAFLYRVRNLSFARRRSY